MAKITQPNLPADLPENWNNSQYVSADGTVAGLTPKHGYNYLMQQVNNAQKAVNTLAQQAQTDLTGVEKQVGDLEQSVGGLEKGGFNATAQRTGTTVAITGPDGASTVTFLAPSNWVAGDTYTYNGQALTLTDLNGQPVKNGWKQGAPVTLSISGSAAYFAAGASGDFLPLEGGTMTGPAVGAPGAIATPQFRNVQYGTEALTPGVSPLPQGMLYITPEADAGESGGKRTCRFVVGTSTAGWTEADCDYLCDGTADDVEINAAIQALPATGGEIVILDGVYKIASSILIDKSNIKISGNGYATVLERTTKELGYVVSITKPNNTICGLCFKENFSVYNSNYSSIGIGQDSNDILICDCYAIDAYCFVASNNSSGIIIKSNTISKSKNGVVFYSGDSYHSNIVTENVFLDIYNVGIEIYGNASIVAGNTIRLSNEKGNSGDGIRFGTSNGACTGNTVIDSGEAGISVRSDFSAITGNTVKNCEEGIDLIGSSQGNVVSGNTAIRGTGLPSDYSGGEKTISVGSTKSKNNLFIGNSIMGKNYVDSGTGNTWANNKYQ